MVDVIACAHFTVLGIALALLTATFPYDLYHYYIIVTNVILYFVLAFSTVSVSKWLFNRKRIQPQNKAVLITGCASGFGKELAKRLDNKGFKVFASCHYADGPGVDDLKRSCSDRLKVFCLDISKDESVEKAVNFVKQNLGSSVLWAVVNNAGTARIIAPFEMTPLDNYTEILNVNALGPVRVTKAFLPLLKESKGRIVNINSILGRKPFFGLYGYTMSKYAEVAFTESLRLEMNEYGIRVVSIEPEIFRTGITDTKKYIDYAKTEISKVNKGSSYGEEYEKKLINYTANYLNLASLNFDNVIDDIESAITLKIPCQVYMPCRSIISHVFFVIAKNVPLEIYDTVALIGAKILGFPLPKAKKNL